MERSPCISGAVPTVAAGIDTCLALFDTTGAELALMNAVGALLGAVETPGGAVVALVVEVTPIACGSAVTLPNAADLGSTVYRGRNPHGIKG